MDSVGEEGFCYLAVGVKDKITYVEERMELKDGSKFEDPQDHLRYNFFLWELQALLSAES